MQTQTVENPFVRSPTLDTVLMVEKTIEENSGEYNRTELWKKLPRQVMWQTFLVILDYLEKSGKIIIDKAGCIIWTFNPARIKKLIKENLIIR